MPTLSVDGTALYYERRGAGEPLLLIQGMTGHSLHWGEPFLGALDRHFELLLCDYRGVGRSAPCRGGFSVADLASDAIALLDGLNVERAHVFGTSMGGMVAQEIALTHPERVLTLILGSTSCGGPPAKPAVRALVRRLSAGLTSTDAEQAIRASWELNVSSAYAGAAGNYERFCELVVQLPVPLPAAVAQAQAVMAHDTSERLTGIGAPTLVLHGTDDQMLPAELGMLVAKLVPNARLELLDRVGHLCFWEQPERVAQLIHAHATAAAPSGMQGIAPSA